MLKSSCFAHGIALLEITTGKSQLFLAKFNDG